MLGGLWQRLFGRRQRLQPLPPQHVHHHYSAQNYHYDQLQRATDLLLSHLSPNQQQNYKNHDYFYVQSQTGKHYQIKAAGSCNVCLLNTKGNPTMRYCLQFQDGRIPLPDLLLAQKLLLEQNEQLFLKIAVEWPIL